MLFLKIVPYGVFFGLFCGKFQTQVFMLNYRFQLLAPSNPLMRSATHSHRVDQQLYDRSLASIQRLRGRVYLRDGAIQPHELDEEGRFVMHRDDCSWHLLLKSGDETIGCARYLVHPNTVHVKDLEIFRASIVGHKKWGGQVQLAVEADLRRARDHNLSYVEIGGWAICETWRGTRAALEILTASYALAPMWGGCLASCTATVRHQSASILRRMGGTSFEAGGEALPPYEDPRYGCTMELLRFDSRSPAEKFVPLISCLQTTFSCIPTISRSAVPLLWSLGAATAEIRKTPPLHMLAAQN